MIVVLIIVTTFIEYLDLLYIGWFVITLPRKGHMEIFMVRIVLF